MEKIEKEIEKQYNEEVKEFEALKIELTDERKEFLKRRIRLEITLWYS